MSFFLEWLIFYIAIIFSMSIDNLFWIPTSPEYLKFKNNNFPILVDGETYWSRTGYIIKYRIWSVLTHWRDIVPAIITSFILALIF